MVVSVCPESYPRVLSHLLRWQAADSGLSPVPCGSECASPVDQPCLHCGASLGGSPHDLVSESGGLGLSGAGGLVGMAILSPQQLGLHWCVGWEGEGPHETDHLGDWT